MRGAHGGTSRSSGAGTDEFRRGTVNEPDTSLAGVGRPESHGNVQACRLQREWSK